MKCIGTVCLIAVSLLLVACDPGITIRQINSSSGTQAQATIRVKTQHQLIGNTQYVPQVTVTNNSDSLLTINSVELVTKLGVFTNKPQQVSSYPMGLKPGKTETLDLWFDLTNDVRTTFFRQPAELLVHFSVGGRAETAHVGVVGGPLDTESP